MATSTTVFWPVAIWKPRVGGPGRPGDGEAQGMLVEVGATAGADQVRVVGRLTRLEEWVRREEVTIVLGTRLWVRPLEPKLLMQMLQRLGPRG